MSQALAYLGISQPVLIGNGSSGTVFKALLGGDTVAVKCMGMPQNHKAFMAEKKLTNIQHPNIVALLKAECIDNMAFMITEFHPKDLMTIIEEQQQIEIEQAKHLFFQLCSAIAHAHSHNIAHLDIKPENIFISRTTSAILGDWGSSVYFNQCPQTSNVIGTFFYCPPEMLCSRPYFPEKCDAWSLGILLHTIVTGKWPYCGNSEEEIIYNVNHGNVQIETGFGMDFAILVSSFLQVEPSRRISASDALLSPWLASVNPQVKKKKNRISIPPFSSHGGSRRSQEKNESVETRPHTGKVSNIRSLLNPSSPPPKRKRGLHHKLRKIIS